MKKDIKLSWPKFFKRCFYCGYFLILVPYRLRNIGGETEQVIVCRSCMSRMTDGYLH